MCQVFVANSNLFACGFCCLSLKNLLYIKNYYVPLLLALIR